MSFFHKMKGGGQSPPAVGLSEILWSWLGAFFGIMPVAFLNYNLFGGHLWLASSLAVATAIAAMHTTKTMHPPGGATALIAVIGSQKIHDLGFYYVLAPVGASAFIMLVVALLVNNFCKTRQYPEFWF